MEKRLEDKANEFKAETLWRQEIVPFAQSSARFLESRFRP
jgi:hypothetical protein